MVNRFDVDIKISKEVIFKKLKFVENTESYRNADEVFDELTQIIAGNMITCLYSIFDNSYDLPFYKTIGSKKNKVVICFLSLDDKISKAINDYINEGYYLKGYLLNEIATYTIFNTSNEMNEEIKKKLLELGFLLTKRYSPGDGDIDLKYQQIILDTLKKDVNIDAYLTENYMIVPEKSMMYFYGAIKIENCDYDLNVYSRSNESCIECNKFNCQYKEYQ